MSQKLRIIIPSGPAGRRRRGLRRSRQRGHPVGLRLGIHFTYLSDWSLGHHARQQDARAAGGHLHRAGRGRHPASGPRLLRVALPRARMEQAARHLQEGRHLYGRGCLRDLLRARRCPWDLLRRGRPRSPLRNRSYLSGASNEGHAPFRRREARPENLVRGRMLLLRRPKAGRFPPHYPGRHPAFRRHLRIPGILPGMPRGSVVRHGVSAYRAVRRRRCHLVGAHHPGADSRRGDLLP